MRDSANLVQKAGTAVDVQFKLYFLLDLIFVYIEHQLHKASKK